MRTHKNVRFWPLVALALTAPAGAVHAQYSEISFSAGAHLSDDDDDRFGSTRGRVELSVHRAFPNGLLVRAGLAGAVLGPPPCPPPPGTNARWHIEIGTSLEGHLDIGLSLPIGSVISLEPFIGSGARYLTEAETDDPSPLAFGMPSSTSMLVSGGATAYLRVTDTVRVFSRVRMSRHFIGAQTLEALDGETLEHDLPNLDTASLTAGLALRF